MDKTETDNMHTTVDRTSNEAHKNIYTKQQWTEQTMKHTEIYAHNSGQNKQ